MISQTLGTFSIGLNGEISFDFNGNDSTITDFGEMSFNQPVKISQKLIDEAERIKDLMDEEGLDEDDATELVDLL